MFDKTPGANVRHAYLGAVLAMAASLPNLTIEELKGQFTITTEEPYVEVNVIDTWANTFDSLQQWIQLYIQKAQGVPAFLKDAEQVPEKASNVIRNAGSDYGDLDLMAKAKMVKATTTSCNQVKNAIKKIINEAKQIGADLQILKDTLNSLQADI